MSHFVNSLQDWRMDGPGATSEGVDDVTEEDAVEDKDSKKDQEDD